MSHLKNDCYQCVNKRDVPGNHHIQCVKPDQDMTGSEHGIRRGWFMYPWLFDPIWATATCKNFEPVNLARQSSSNSE